MLRTIIIILLSLNISLYAGIFSGIDNAHIEGFTKKISELQNQMSDIKTDIKGMKVGLNDIGVGMNNNKKGISDSLNGLKNSVVKQTTENNQRFKMLEDINLKIKLIDEMNLNLSAVKDSTLKIAEKIELNAQAFAGFQKNLAMTSGRDSITNDPIIFYWMIGVFSAIVTTLLSMVLWQMKQKSRLIERLVFAQHETEAERAKKEFYKGNLIGKNGNA